MSLEEPVPAWRVAAQLCAPRQGLVPGVKYLAQVDVPEPGPGQAMLHFERQPEFLPQPLVAEATEGEIV